MKIDSKFDFEKMTVKLLRDNNKPIVELYIYFWNILGEFQLAGIRDAKQLQDSGKLQS